MDDWISSCNHLVHVGDGKKDKRSDKKYECYVWYLYACHKKIKTLYCQVFIDSWF